MEGIIMMIIAVYGFWGAVFGLDTELTIMFGSATLALTLIGMMALGTITKGRIWK